LLCSQSYGDLNEEIAVQGHCGDQQCGKLHRNIDYNYISPIKVLGYAGNFFRLLYSAEPAKSLLTNLRKFFYKAIEGLLHDGRKFQLKWCNMLAIF
jgi:hypothetical protein